LIGTLSDGALAWIDTETGIAGPRIPYPSKLRSGCASPNASYGITADARGRIWLAGWDCGDVLGYDPATSQWTRIPSAASLRPGPAP
jgi:streptogramin lyase